MIEVDVRLGSDGTPWLLHDAHLDRTTNARGPIEKQPDSALAGVRLADGSRLPRLSEAIEVFSRHASPGDVLCLDVKTNHPLHSELFAHVAPGSIQVWSDHIQVVRTAACSGIETVLCSPGLFPKGLGGFLWSARVNHASAVSFFPADIDDFVAKACANAGLPFQSGTPNDLPTWRRLIRLNAASIVTDRPLELQALLRKGPS